MTTSTRRPAADLDDADLERELERLHQTRHETFINGSAESFQAHTDRMLELEVEYADRFPGRTTPDPMRTRDGSREQDGRGA